MTEQKKKSKMGGVISVLVSSRRQNPDQQQKDIIKDTAWFPDRLMILVKKMSSLASERLATCICCSGLVLT